MKIKHNGENIDVNSRLCPFYFCFRPGFYTHHSAAGYYGCSSRTDKNKSCLTRDNHGCPGKLEYMDYHMDKNGKECPGKFSTIKSTGGYCICKLCGMRMPKEMAKKILGKGQEG